MPLNCRAPGTRCPSFHAALTAEQIEALSITSGSTATAWHLGQVRFRDLGPIRERIQILTGRAKKASASCCEVRSGRAMMQPPGRGDGKSPPAPPTSRQSPTDNHQACPPPVIDIHTSKRADSFNTRSNPSGGVEFGNELSATYQRHGSPGPGSDLASRACIVPGTCLAGLNPVGGGLHYCTNV